MKGKVFLALVAVLLLLGLTYRLGHHKGYEKATSTSTNKISSASVIATDPITLERVHELINRARADVGVSPLALDAKLNLSAKDKCQDMVARDYFSHDTPDGQEPWVFIVKYYPNYIRLGENLAEGYKTSKSLVSGWIASTTHYENIINPVFDIAGLGICYSDNYEGRGARTVVVHHFAKFAP